MEPQHADYDSRYLMGILFFNAGDYFEAHEAWEEIWMDSTGHERRFYQGLIQAAVGLLHFGNGNLRGAIKLYHSGREYMRELGPRFLGLDVSGFWVAMDRCFAPLIANLEPPSSALLPEDALPVIDLDPPPTSWPTLKASDDDG